MQYEISGDTDWSADSSRGPVNRAVAESMFAALQAKKVQKQKTYEGIFLFAGLGLLGFLILRKAGR